jgi:hypothetical protein
VTATMQQHFSPNLSGCSAWGGCSLNTPLHLASSCHCQQHLNL